MNWHPPKDKPANLHFLGARPYEKLPYYLKGLDVCIVPFKDNAVSRAASPLKFYEYLAAGRAVVTTPIPDWQYLSSVAWLAKTLDDFLYAIEEALEKAFDQKEQERRLAAVAQHSWQKRAETALLHIKGALKYSGKI